MKPIITYAQNREDIILSAFFKDSEKGFYVDIGAFDPKIDSVTQYFYERGWNGINVEPNRHLYEEFLSARPKDVNLNIAVSDKKEKVILREYTDGLGLSTVDQKAQQSYEADGSGLTDRYDDVEVQADTLAHIFQSNGVKSVDFLKIDVEGNEYKVLAGNNWEKYRPKVICIEANHIDVDWHGLLEKNDYELVFFDGLNEYFSDRTKPEIKENFAYIPMVIGREILHDKHYSALQLLERDIAGLRGSVERLIQQNTKAAERIAQLNNAIRVNARFRNQLKGVFQALDNVVSVRIAKLNPARYRHAPIAFSSDMSAKDLIDAAHASDIETFSRKRGNIVKAVTFFVLDTVHAITKRVAQLGFRALKKVYRGIKRSI
jgi:FkbM family methyltransferase